MIFHKLVEKIYRSKMYIRCDDTGLVKFFSVNDFPEIVQEGYSFSSSLGHKLQGYFYHHHMHNLSGGPLVIFDHGFGGGHLAYMKEISILCNNGFTVFAYDHTGCMESGGANTNGLAQSLHDLDDCIKALNLDDNYHFSDIYVIGHSWGGFAALNITSLHPDIKKIVVLSGFVSVEKLINQYFSGILKGYRKHILKLEADNNPYYVGYDATKTFDNFDVNALLIYSDNDQMVDKKIHFDSFYQEIKNQDKVKYIITSNKGHNPNYTESAVNYLQTFHKALNKAKKLKTNAEKEQFKNSFDWDKMTEQDEQIMQSIIEFLNN